MKQVFFVLMMSLVALKSDAQIFCSGEIAIPNSQHKKIVTISFNNLSSEDWISLSSPIISDLEPEVSLRITAVEGTERKKIVSAIYEGFTGAVKFEYVKAPDESSYITGFQGVEEGLPFGPSDLICGISGMLMANFPH